MLTILLGPPGSGKGTQAEIIRKKYGLFQVSTGDILRDKMAKNKHTTNKISEIMGTGKLFPDEMINELVEENIKTLLQQENYHGLLFDGYPRTINQAKFLESMLKNKHLNIDCVLIFLVPDELIIDRISARRIDKKTGKVYNLIFNPPPINEKVDLFQRIDDTEEIMKNRLEIYRQQTEPLIEYYSKSKLVEFVDTSSADIDVNSKKILNILDKYQ